MRDAVMKYSYQEVIDIIQNTRRFGSNTGYEVSRQILKKLGNPQEGIPFVHVAGTNGKGSVTAFLCRILEQTGRKVGMFTSPHLVDFEERIRINGRMIPKEEVTRLGNRLLEMEFELPPTMFDYCLAMAVLYFREQQCDIMVMETGIGGRWDSTNALGVPELAVITKIGLDHTAILGETLAQIAFEKAGILKPGCPLVTVPQEEEVRKVLQEEFARVNAGVSQVPCLWEVTAEDMKYAQSLPRQMKGSFQTENSAAAICAARLLLGEEERNEEHIKAGIAQTFWKGRMELVNEHPFFMIDGAHNAHGVRALANGLSQLYPGEKFHFIMAVMADKDYEAMIEELLPLAIDFVTVTPESSRALQAGELAECIRRKQIVAEYSDDLEAVIRPFLPGVEVQTTDTAKTVAFGSLYFIGAIEKMLQEA